tara:strand:+ start:1559 stop:2092 length:534 start_codon:yes stop_codon:yes gene_type:complete
MSNKTGDPKPIEIKKQVSEKLVVVEPATIESLNVVKYQDLLETFTVLGVPDAWKPGSAREKMIGAALEKLSIIRELEAKGLKGQELQAAKANAYIQADTLTGNVAQAEALNNDLKAVEVKKEVEAKVLKMSLSKEQAQKNLDIINANLNGASPGGRKILLQKRKILQDLLEKDEFEN